MNDIATTWSKLVVNGKVPRSTLETIEAAMVADAVPDCSKLEVNEACPVRHYHSGGLYAREMSIPAGVAVVGGIHKHKHLAMLVKGDLSILSEDGVSRMQGPVMFESTPGIKRVAYAHTDVIFTTFHDTDETDPDKIWKMFIADSYEEYDKLLIESEGL